MTALRQRRVLLFAGPRRLAWRTEPCPSPGPGQVQVQVHWTAPSPGTEGLLYRGEWPADLPLDDALPALQGRFAYPVAYGYSAVGRVVQTGPDLSEDWRGRWVFAFQPHASCFVAPAEQVRPLPPDLTPEDATFLPNLETAVNLLLDAAPLIGEHVIVLGQGVVGLLTTGLLAALPLGSLTVVDRYANRRAAALAWGAQQAVPPPRTPEEYDALRQGRVAHPRYPGADVVLELSGAPAALQTAIEVAAFAGRIVVGSWYGAKPATLHLGGRFHRARLRLVSSQVTTLAPALQGRWTVARRWAVAEHHARRLRPAAHLVTHRLPAARAADAYALLDAHPEQAIQVLLDWRAQS